MKLPDPNARELPSGAAAPLRILYITGSDRSGTTLLDRVVGAGERAFSGGEIHQIFRRGIVANELCSCGEPFDRCPVWRSVATRVGLLDRKPLAAEIEADKQALVRIRNIRSLARGGSLVTRKDAARIRSYLAAVYHALAETTGARMIVDSSKHPALPLVLRPDPTLDIRVVHVVRDSRGVVNSWSRLKPRLEAVGHKEYLDRPGLLRSCHLWNIAHLGSEALGRELPRIRIRYEDFVGDVQGTLRRVARFADMPEDAWNGIVQGDTLRLPRLHTLAGNPMRLGGETIQVRLDDAWRRELGSARRAAVTLLTLPGLLRYGYL